MEKFLQSVEAGEKPKFAMIEMDLASQSIQNTETGQSVRLAPREYQIVWMLVRAQGERVKIGEMDDFIYRDLPDEKDLPLTNTNMVSLGRARKKMLALTENKMTIAVDPSFGYYLALHA